MLYQVCCTQGPCPCGSPLLIRTYTGDTQTQFCLSLCRVSGSLCTQGLFESSECLWWRWGVTLNVNSPLLPSCWGFSFALGCGVSFFGGLQHSPVNGCSAVSCSFGVLTGEVDCMSFYYTILHQTQALITLSRASRETARGPVAPWVPTAAAFCRKMCSHKTS